MRDLIHLWRYRPDGMPSGGVCYHAAVQPPLDGAPTRNQANALGHRGALRLGRAARELLRRQS